MLRLAVASRAETYERMQAPLAERGIEVVGIRPAKRRFDLGSEPFPDVDVGFVFPPRLMEGGVVDACLDVPWVNDRLAVLGSRNKAEVLARLGRAGLPVPDTQVVSTPVEDDVLMAAFRAIDGPVLVKPNSTSRGVGIARAHDLDSFLGIVDYVDLVHDFRATADRSFLVQEFLDGARDVRVMVLDGEAVGAVERELPVEGDAIEDGQWKHNVHRGASATPIPLADLPDLGPRDCRDLAERVAGELEIPFLGVDLLVTEDRVVVSETNARPTIDDVEKYDAGFWDRLAGLVEATAAGVRE